LNRLVLAVLERCPSAVRRSLIFFYRWLQFRLWKLRVFTKTRHIKPTYDIYKTIWIDPSKIEFVCEPGGKKGRLLTCGEVAGGDWDKAISSFDSLDVYRALKNRIEEQWAWDETQFYSRVLMEIDKGNYLWGCKNREELNGRCASIDRLYETINGSGYKTKEELSNDAEDPFWDHDEVIVHIDRDGRLLFGDGRHRLAIAKILGLQSIPAKVGRRHANWVEFRSEIIQYANEMYGGKVYHSLMHPDLRDIPASHSLKRFEIIEQHVPTPPGQVLDIGANWGFMSHCFENLGFACVAVENSPRDVYFLKKLRDAEGKKFEVISTDVLEYQDKTRFKIVLALNIFHHFIKTEFLHDRLVKFLNRIETEVVFFEPHNIEEPQMVGAYRNYDHEEFVAFVLKHSGLTTAINVGMAEDGRPIYKMSR